MDNRIFQLDTQWNIIHYPEKPNGFGILIIGDERHFIDESKSFWLTNEGKHALIHNLKQSGYTIFSSNLYGKNWGSRKAVVMASRLYQHVMRNEILNGKIHILAEGMGALVAIDLLKEMHGQIRSAVLINPILSLKHHLEQEKEHKFFYKKLLAELSAAYDVDKDQIEFEILEKKPLPEFNTEVPVKLIHILAGGRAYTQTALYQEILKEKLDRRNITASFMTPEKKQQMGTHIIRFFHLYEKDL